LPRRRASSYGRSSGIDQIEIFALGQIARLKLFSAIRA
jgi:hypothetical protein